MADGLSLLEQVEQVLDERVRPHLHEHHGDVEIEELDEQGVLKVRLLGQCSGCPSAALTTEMLIADEVRAALPEVTSVLLLGGVSASLLAQARDIMARRAK